MIIDLLTSEKWTFSDPNPLVYAGSMAGDHILPFSPAALLALPGRATDCPGARVQGNRDADGRPQVFCSFHPGEIVRPLPPGVELSSALILAS